MNRTIFGAIALLSTVSSVAVANAADLPRRPPAAIVAPAPIYNWTGCYVGGNIGGAWGRADLTDVNSGAGISATNSGVAGGIQGGCDYQMGAWVVGIRNMFDGTSLSGSGTFGSGALNGYTASTNTGWFDTLTGRVGYLIQPNWLLYGQGGVAWIGTNQYLKNAAGSQVAQFSNGKTGYTVGLGTEYMFAPHWSAFLEYNYINVGSSTNSFSAAGGCAGGCTVNTKADSQNVLVGVNYRF